MEEDFKLSSRNGDERLLDWAGIRRDDEKMMFCFSQSRRYLRGRMTRELTFERLLIARITDENERNRRKAELGQKIIIIIRDLSAYVDSIRGIE